MLESIFLASFSELLARLGEHFSRRDLLRQANAYLRGLLSQVDRKNSWQLANTPSRRVASRTARSVYLWRIVASMGTRSGRS